MLSQRAAVALPFPGRTGNQLFQPLQPLLLRVELVLHRLRNIRVPRHNTQHETTATLTCSMRWFNQNRRKCVAESGAYEPLH